MSGNIKAVCCIWIIVSISLSSAVYGRYECDVSRELNAQVAGVVSVDKKFTFSRVRNSAMVLQLAWKKAVGSERYVLEYVGAERMLPVYQVNEVYTTKIPNVSFVDEGGRRYFAKEFSGQIVIIYIWASWCLSCISELQQFNILKEKLLYECVSDVEILPITVDFKDVAFLQKLYKEKKIDKLGIFLDKQREILKTFLVNVVPTTIVLDRRLHIIQRIENQVDWSSDDLYQWVAQLKK